MSVHRAEGRRVNHRALRPTLDGRLEARYLLAKAGAGILYLANPQIGFAYRSNNPPHLSGHAPEFRAQQPLSQHLSKETGHGGQKVRIYQDGGVWDVTLSEYTPAISAGGTNAQTAGTSSTTSTALYPPPYQSPGTVRAYPLGNGTWGIIADGTTALSDLTINPVPFPQRKGYAHSFAYSYAARPRILRVGSLIVTSGQIGAIEGFHSADLSGPLSVGGTDTVDRIALNSILPGASIYTGGTLNTLDVFGGINLSGGPSIVVSRDLNLVNVGQDINLNNGSSFFVGRNLGALPQPAKGSATGSNVLSINQSLLGTQSTLQLPNVSGYIQGSLNIGPGSTFTIARGIGQSNLTLNNQGQPISNNVIDIQGNVTGASRIIIPNGSIASPANPTGNVIINGTITP